MSLSRTAPLAALCGLALALSGCGKGAEKSNAVAMKDLEVTDGTATDAMTDLDGVQAQGTAMVPTGEGNSSNAAAPKAAANASAPAGNESADEAVPDQ